MAAPASKIPTARNRPGSLDSNVTGGKILGEKKVACNWLPKASFCYESREIERRPLGFRPHERDEARGDCEIGGLPKKQKRIAMGPVTRRRAWSAVCGQGWSVIPRSQGGDITGVDWRAWA
jgi:hypothetical protein